MRTALLFLVSLLGCTAAFSQTNVLNTNPLTEQIMLGNYDPATYQASSTLDQPSQIIEGIHAEVSPDSLQAYITRLSGFENRNTGADTVSDVRGMGAARRWVFQKFEEFSSARDNRLIPSYLQFDQEVCGMTQHRNIFCVLPGTNVDDPSMVLIQGHIDSRCEDPCDIDCVAQGSEDNASGTALVMELARVMSKYTFERTIVFMATTGEEQGLFGARAFAQYTVDKNIKVKAVLNNDTVGGIICGATSSEPSCPGLNHIDSTQVRLFSSGSQNSPHKALARYTKLQYEEELLAIVSVPMQISIMSFEDRLGRGGDHIPFSDRGISAIRFTTANEHGNAVIGPDYTDRQHSTRDILGVDTDGDNVIDSFFVDFNYLARNTVINGVSGGLIAVSPETPGFEAEAVDGIIKITIQDPLDYDHYRIGLRSVENDFDTVYTLIGGREFDIIPEIRGQYSVSVASVDEHGIESCFSDEEIFSIFTLELEEIAFQAKAIELLQNRPNPFDEITYISCLVNESVDYREAHIQISDLSGKELMRLPIQLNLGVNEITYRHGYGQIGTHVYSLVIDGEVYASKRMIFAY
ncbi:MAG: M28 family peptidase [Bacteroidota bacterium]